MSDAPSRVAYIAASLDGFIATGDGGVGWLDAFQDHDYGYDAFLATVGVLVMGRATYEQVRGFGDWPYPGRRCIVLTGRGLTGAPPDVTAWPGDAASLAGHLAELPERVWIVGGGRLIAALLAEGAVTELDLFIMPVLLGRGVPLFAGGHPPAQALRLIETRSWPNGVVRLRYCLKA